MMENTIGYEGRGTVEGAEFYKLLGLLLDLGGGAFLDLHGERERVCEYFYSNV